MYTIRDLKQVCKGINTQLRNLATQTHDDIGNIFLKFDKSAWYFIPSKIKNLLSDNVQGQIYKTRYVYTFKIIFLNFKIFPIVYTQPVFKLYFGTDHLASIYLSSTNRLYGDKHIHDEDSDLQSYRSVNGRLAL